MHKHKRFIAKLGTMTCATHR